MRFFVGNKINTTHGLSRTTEYRSWQEAKQRCFNKNNKRYKYYGARGILMCALWKDDFCEFIKYMGKKPKGTTLDRIDNNRGYAPGNCRWATGLQQVQNRRNSIWLSHNGKHHSLKEWSEILNIKYDTLLHRHLAGASAEKTLSPLITKT